MSPLGNTLGCFSRCETKHNLKWREPAVIIRTVTCELQQIFTSTTTADRLIAVDNAGQCVDTLITPSSTETPIDLSVTASVGTPPASSYPPLSSSTSDDSDTDSAVNTSSPFPVCHNLSPSTIHRVMKCLGNSPNEDPRDGITSSDSINYRSTLDFLKEQIYRNASAHDKTHPDKLPGIRPTVDQDFRSIADENEFERGHYSVHFVNPLDDNATARMHIQNNNAIIYWLGIIHTIVNDLATLDTYNTSANHG